VLVFRSDDGRQTFAVGRIQQVERQFRDHSPVADPFARTGPLGRRRVAPRLAERWFRGAQQRGEFAEVLASDHGMPVGNAVQGRQLRLLFRRDHGAGRIVDVDQVQVALAGGFDRCARLQFLATRDPPRPVDAGHSQNDRSLAQPVAAQQLLGLPTRSAALSRRLARRLFIDPDVA